MIATIINCALVLLGSAIGILFRNRISQSFTHTISQVLGLCVLVIGVSAALQSRDTLCLVVCMVAGTAVGQAVDIEGKLDGLGEGLRTRLGKLGSGRFTEGFVAASVLFCVGSMAITGAMDAGIRGEYGILLSKGVLDGVTAITLAAAMGVGVAFCVVPLLLYQGGLTLVAAAVAPWLSQGVMHEMSAAGGVIIMGIAVNMMGLGTVRLRAGNLLPAIFMPLGYLPLTAWLATLW